MTCKIIYTSFSAALLGLSLICTTTNAEDSTETQIINGCKKISSYAAQGNTAYQKKQYTKALDAYTEQASWLSFCSIHEELTGKTVTDNQLSTAYNNVGLTYSKLNKPRWARAWYAIMLKDTKSQFNLKALGPIRSTTEKAGTYVKYIGQGQWDHITVSKAKNGYDIEYAGLRMGANAMIYGPNMGEFNTTMSNASNKARYTYEGCVIDLEFNQGDSVRVKQNQPDCGFGMGVYAEGFYWKVEG